MTQKVTLHHPAFKFIRQQHISSLNIDVQEFEHSATGAQHIHLAAASEENVFLVALRTVPKDSTGVAHILEHTALCGSQKYPVRDPFFMMTRRSLNTFMNAFTSSDWTAYPFASLNRKDFSNLLDVYLDAVFFSRLDPLDFAQEGHRLEFAEPENPESPLMYKGVVFNEMKGAMSSVSSQLWQTLTKHLFPTSTYHYNSGGDPESIPDLTYEQLVAFYRTHYHPSNAVFMTFGDISAEDHQTRFQEQVLQHFNKLDYKVSVEDEKRYYAPIRVQEAYPYNDPDAERKTHVVMAWLLGKSTNLRDTLRAQLLSSILLDNSATPLMHVLESSEYGNGPSPMCGLDDSQRELSFLCGLEGCDRNASEDVETLILKTLDKVVLEGIPQEDIESALHQLELHQREIGGDSYPYGLQLILTALTAATHRGDPVRLLDLEASLAQLREDIKDPDFVKNLTRELLLDNPHRITLALQPNDAIKTRRDAAEAARLADIKAGLSEDDKNAIVAQAKALKHRQNQEDDAGILPKVTLADVPKGEVDVSSETRERGSIKITHFPTGTNGLVYQQVIHALPALDEDNQQILPLYTSCLTELGAGNRDYLQMQKWQASVAGGINVFSSVRGRVDNVHEVSAYVTYSGKALNRNQKPLTELMATTMAEARFDEHVRIKELVAQIRAHKEQSVTGNGHGLAMLAAASGICASANMSHRVSGLEGIRAIKRLDKAINEDAALAQLAEKLAALHQRCTSTASELLLIGEDEFLEDFESTLVGAFSSSQNTNDAFALPEHKQAIQQAWLTNSQVHFCAKAFPTVAPEHADAAPLIVLGGFLRNGFLHKAIREQGGAYGGGASQDSNSGAFRFYSYRDPRLAETLSDFDNAVEWLLSTDHGYQPLEEAILGTISSIDKSESPAGRAKRLFHSELHGRNHAFRQQLRERVLATTVDDLKRVAQTYLQPDQANTAVITDFSSRETVAALGLDIIEL
ncbi:insulinase family protein [Teredinibacter turnerae]|uniref:insulinase family protein n=1 Tax=Teredinibacter turnerae TaxID=2426 RepID=UPI00040214D2|nr:insulinase family protein [Teredinibacter turnerae]